MGPGCKSRTPSTVGPSGGRAGARWLWAWEDRGP